MIGKAKTIASYQWSIPLFRDQEATVNPAENQELNSTEHDISQRDINSGKPHQFRGRLLNVRRPDSSDERGLN